MITTSAVDTALQQERVTWFLGVRIDAKVGPVARLLEGGGEVTVPGDGTYYGSDDTWGSLASLDNIGDGVDEQAPSLSITLLPDALSDVATIASPQQQGSRTRIYLGVLDVNTKAVIPDPLQLFDGQVDVPTLGFEDGGRDVSFDLVSNFDLLFLDDEGSRLNPANHKYIWPGETGLDDITGVTRQVIGGPGDKLSGGTPGGVIASPPNSPFGGGAMMGGSYGGGILGGGFGTGISGLGLPGTFGNTF